MSLLITCNMPIYITLFEALSNGTVFNQYLITLTPLFDFRLVLPNSLYTKWFGSGLILLIYFGENVYVFILT